MGRHRALRSCSRGRRLDRSVRRQDRAIERGSGGRLGVAVFDTGSGRGPAIAWTSAFRCAARSNCWPRPPCWRASMRGEERLDRRIAFREDDLVTYSPVTEKHVGDGMTLAELCDAAITLSDNTAGNLLLASLGGPQGLTALRAHARRHDDPPRPHRDRRSTRRRPATRATPRRRRRCSTTCGAGARRRAVARLARAVDGWLVANKTGDARLRAGLPADWRVGDKTGSGEHGTTNDVGVIWPPDRAPLVVTAYLTRTGAIPFRDSQELQPPLLAQAAEHRLERQTLSISVLNLCLSLSVRAQLGGWPRADTHRPCA